MGSRIIKTSIVCAFIAFIIVLGVVIIPNGKYNDAIALMDAGKYEQAVDVWRKIDGYKDATDQIMKCFQYLGYHKTVIDYYEYTEYTIPDGVTSIDDEAFSECTGLTSIIIPDSVTSIGEKAFSECTGLTSITIPDSVTSIGEGVFANCTGLTSITVPDSVTRIGRYAFFDCEGLTSITIPDSVTFIGGEAFAFCYELTSITIPDSVTRIAAGAFAYCEKLTSIKYRGTEAEWEAISKGKDIFRDAGSSTITYEYKGE